MPNYRYTLESLGLESTALAVCTANNSIAKQIVQTAFATLEFHYIQNGVTNFKQLKAAYEDFPLTSQLNPISKKAAEELFQKLYERYLGMR